MKRFAYLAFAVILPVAVQAQSNYSFDDEVNAELEKMYQQGSSSSKSKASTPESTPQVQVNVQANPAVQAHQSSSQGAVSEVKSSPVVSAPIVAAAVTAPMVAPQVQPTTLIESTPLKESKAEAIRKSRQDAELSTEQSIVERLEASRLEDEKRRASVLFGDKFGALAQGDQKPVEVAKPVAPSPVPVVIPEQVVAPVATPVVEKKVELDREAVRSEVKASLAEIREEETKKTPEGTKTYFSGLVGMGDYPDVKNVRGTYALGFSVGQKFNDRLLVEGSFIFSKFDVEQKDGGTVCDFYSCTTYPRITEMTQYQGSALAKYQIMSGMLRPVFGGVLAYTYRTFTDTQFAISNNDASSHAVDLGLMTGADLEISETFSLGLDIRYMWNLTSRTNSSGFQKSFSQSVYGSDTAIEKYSYMNVGLVGRATF